jgi:hypothetical protein
MPTPKFAQSRRKGTRATPVVIATVQKRDCSSATRFGARGQCVQVTRGVFGYCRAMRRSNSGAPLSPSNIGSAESHPRTLAGSFSKALRRASMASLRRSQSE